MEVKPLITDKIYDTLGIIGGMGSMACEYLFNEIIENTYAENDRDHLDIIIVNHASMRIRGYPFGRYRRHRRLGAVRKR